MVPKRKVSKSCKRSRRSHHALRPMNLVECPQCSAARLPHRACMDCGYVNGRISLKVEADEA
ncbi:MAG: 50S ribosomal protein L32 [Phycisphaerales bacterium]|nr:50S ribosomal protein L32 [Phycisphaerales bacterium]MCB9862052.1 50S ribosomal protein L32 [Phycisphaerales bacterium]